VQIAEAYVELRVKSDRARAEARDQARSTAQEVTRQFAQVFSAVVVVNELRKMTDAASNLEQAIGGTAAIFGRSSRVIDDFARTSAQSFGISERAARELTSQIGGLLSGLGFTQTEAANTSVKLAQLGADLAATFGGRPEEAVQALGAALRGEFDPLERFGISLRQSAINAKAVELGLAESTAKVDDNARAQAALALITEQSAGAQGQFGREAETAAGKQARFTAELENQRAKIGEVLIPVFTTLISLVGGAVDVFADMPAPIQGAVVALIALAAVAGPVGNAVGAVKDLTGFLGRMPPIVAGVTGALTIALGVYTLYASEKQKATQRTNEFIEALKAEAEGQRGATDALLAAEFSQSKYQLALGELGLSVADVVRAVKGEYVPALDDLNQRRLTASVEGHNDLAGSMTRLQDQIGLQSSALGTASEQLDRQTEATGDLSRSTQMYVDYAAAMRAELGLGTQATEDQADATEEVAGATRRLVPQIGDLSDEWGLLTATVDAFNTALDRVLGGYLGVDEATTALFDSAERLNEALTTNGATLDVATKEGRDNRDTVRSQVSAILEFASANVRAGESTESAAATVSALTEQLKNQLTQAGLTREEVDAYIATLGLTPENVTTALELANVEVTRQQLTDHLAAITSIPEETRTRIQALIDEDAFALAELRLEQLTRRRIVQVAPSGTGAQQGGQRSALGRFVAGGSYMFTSVGENPGRSGDEVILPLGNRSRLAELLADPRVSDRVAAAMPQASGGGGVAVPTSMTVVIEGRPFRAAIVDYQTEIQGAI
jgi:methyl-accepting chemotaxis protein